MDPNYRPINLDTDPLGSVRPPVDGAAAITMVRWANAATGVSTPPAAYGEVATIRVRRLTDPGDEVDVPLPEGAVRELVFAELLTHRHDAPAVTETVSWEELEYRFHRDTGDGAWPLGISRATGAPIVGDVQQDDDGATVITVGRVTGEKTWTPTHRVRLSPAEREDLLARLAKPITPTHTCYMVRAADLPDPLPAGVGLDDFGADDRPFDSASLDRVLGWAESVDPGDDELCLLYVPVGTTLPATTVRAEMAVEAW